MIMTRKILGYFFIRLFAGLLMTASVAFSAGKISGKVTDKSTGNPLPGANLYIESLSIGVATDLEGNYIMLNVPEGRYSMMASYIGYQQKQVDVTVNDKEVTILNIVLNHQTIQGKEVVVTGQAKGQMSAINQQTNANTIKNIVAAEKIQELPESNAAEAVGRLPGVSLQRQGGEGAKVVIRGLSPEYNKIQIEGVDMASTNNWDRSTNLSMISPYMLEGIELTKSAMANQDANQIGGTVNFKIREASETPHLSILAQGGYNGLREEFGDMKYVLQGSRRFFHNLFGIYANVDWEKRNRSSNSVDAGYAYSEVDTTAFVNSLSINDVTRNINRLGGTLVLDFKTPTTKIKLSNVISTIDRENIYRSDVASALDESSTRRQSLTWNEEKMTVMTNALKMEKYIGQFKLDGGVYYSFSENDMPEELNYSGLDRIVITGAIPRNTRPADIPDFLDDNVSGTYLNQLNDSESFTKETEFSADLNLAWEWRISSLMNLKVDTGLKYKEKNKEYDYNTMFLALQYTKNRAYQALLAEYPFMADAYKGGKFLYEPFIDKDYDPGNFMAGNYELERVPKLDLGREMIYFLQDSLGVLKRPHSEPEQFARNYLDSKYDDYHGRENYMAAYLMPTLKIGQNLTLIPGIRYEKNRTAYNGVRGKSYEHVQETLEYTHYDTTSHRENEFFLPMVHAKYKPVDWFDLRAAYTQTLARPSYMTFIPRWDIAAQSLSYNYPDLKPSLSTNYDLYFSFFGDKVGLFTIGGFKKEIEDLIFWYSEIIIDEEMAIEKYGLDPKYTRVDGTSRFVKKSISSYINNPNIVDVWGIETEYQSNLWFLPGLLKNIVLNINYTHTFSEALYPRTIPEIEWKEGPFGGKEPVIVGNIDTSYAAPLLDQPDDILNLTVGYDYKGFSVRASMQYKSDVFTTNAWKPALRGYSDELYLYDLSLKQKLPIEGMILFANFKNLSRSMERSINQGTGYISSESYYGMTADFGIRYDF